MPGFIRVLKNKPIKLNMNREEYLRQILWKTKRALEDYLKYDNTIDYYILSEENKEKILKQINRALQVKPTDQRRRKYE